MVIGASLDLFPSYAQRGSFAVLQGIVAATLALFPSFQPAAPAAAVGRDRRCGARLQPIIGPTPVRGCTSTAAGEPGIQGDPRRRLDAGARARNRAQSRARRAFQLGRFITGRLNRRGRGRGDRALMMQLTCPWCGLRDESEFVCGGTTHLIRPDLAASDVTGANTSSFVTIQRGVHRERWRHAYGCGQWFNLARHTVTHQVLSVYAMTDPPPDHS